MFKKNNIDLAGNKFDIKDKDKYILLEPIWSILENTSEDTKITSEELWKQSQVDPVLGNKLVKELFQEFQKKMIKNIFSLAVNQDELLYSWVFDKMMLMVTRVDTGNNLDIFLLNGLKNKWKEYRGL